MAQFITKQFTNNLDSESVIFFGTGNISLESLKALSKLYSIEAVFTKPDSVNHGKTYSSPVKQWSQENNLKIFQPKNTAEIEEIFDEQAFVSRFGVVVDYGIIISSEVIDCFEMGIINSHFSVLPEWRGADPITFSLLSGQKNTGVSLMKIDDGLDTGDIIAIEKASIEPTDDSDTLTRKLVELSNVMFENYLPNYLLGNIKPQPQTGEPTFSRKLSKEDGLLDWSKSATELEREIRAYKNWPRSYGEISGAQVTITSAKADKYEGKLKPGGLVLRDKKLCVVCGDQSLLIIESLRPAGKKTMSSEAFIAGRPELKKLL